MVFDSDIFTITPSRGAPLRRPSLHTRQFYNVKWSDAIVRSTMARPRGAKRAGLLYERKVIDVLGAIYGTSFTPSPVIRYMLGLRHFAAIPDGVLRVGDDLWIIEVKLAHTERVWEQLMLRYLPLIQVLEPGRTIHPIEICHSYDPAVEIPHKLITSLHRGEAPSGELGVMQWKL